VAAAWFSAVVLNVTANLYAIPRYGVVGASVSCSACYALAFFLILLIAFRHRNSEAAPHRAETHVNEMRDTSSSSQVFHA
jgi:O-antigen/teichoic acid export membrane protein